MLWNARVTAFSISELLRENQLGGLWDSFFDIMDTANYANDATNHALLQHSKIAKNTLINFLNG